jgi:hypothetical protein
VERGREEEGSGGAYIHRGCCSCCDHRRARQLRCPTLCNCWCRRLLLLVLLQLWLLVWLLLVCGRVYTAKHTGAGGVSHRGRVCCKQGVGWGTWLLQLAPPDGRSCTPWGAAAGGVMGMQPRVNHPAPGNRADAGGGTCLCCWWAHCW